jgi:hypothetical protein
VGPQKERVISDRYHYDQRKERNPIGYVSNKGECETNILFFSTHVELYSSLKNTIMTECSNC